MGTKTTTLGIDNHGLDSVFYYHGYAIGTGVRIEVITASLTGKLTRARGESEDVDELTRPAKRSQSPK